MAENIRLPGIGKISQLKQSGVYFNLEKDDIRYLDPVRACETCGKEAPSSDMINFICSIGSPGHHTLPNMQHPDEEHWACSIDCWKKVTSKVINDMIDILTDLHHDTKGSVHNGV
jgi:hypothetical protein